MDERAALERLGGRLPAAGDDCAVVEDLVLTTDMLHETTDFPGGVTRYTAGWRAVGASLSDVAAMGADARAALAVYAAPEFDEGLIEFVDGAQDVCEAVGASYVGGDLDTHEEFTVSTTAVGRTTNPVLRSGAAVGEAVCVTGSLGRSGAALRLFEAGEIERANDLFQFTPRVAAGRDLRPYASAMMDVSDGLARSLHQLADASGCGFAVRTRLPIDESVDTVAEDREDRRELGAFFGEDFELLFTVPGDEFGAARDATDVAVTRIGTVVEEGISLDDEPLPDRGYTHG